MKLIIQIPCYNEEQNIEKTILDLPKFIDGIEQIEYLVINDGSTDNTLEILKKLPVNYIINLHANQGLSKAFSTGIENCLINGADIIVNTDGDNQYKGSDIEKLIKPIIENKADTVIGARDLTQFSLLKRIFQRLGSFMVRIISNTNVKDAPSGFRAYSRESAMRLNVFSNFTYTIETIIQAGANKERFVNVEIVPNADTRKSRLFKNMFQYIRKSVFIVLKSFIIYRPTLFFRVLGTIPILCAIIILLISNQTQMFILSIALFVIGIITWTLSLFAVLEVVNRKLLEEIRYKLK